MNINQLDRYVLIQKRSDTKDDYGQKSASWTTVCDAWANIRPVTGNEKRRSGAIESTVSHTIAIHYNPDLMPLIDADAYRIVLDEGYQRVFGIKSAIDLEERHQWIVFDCEEGSQDGD